MYGRMAINAGMVTAMSGRRDIMVAHLGRVLSGYRMGMTMDAAVTGITGATGARLQRLSSGRV